MNPVWISFPGFWIVSSAISCESERRLLTEKFINRDGRVYLVKNRAVPHDLLKPAADFKIAKVTARRRALRSTTKKPDLAWVFAAERMWFPLKSILRSAYRVRVRTRKPRADWLIFVDGASLTKGRVRQKDRRFLFKSDEAAFEEVMAYFHIDRAIGYLESLGYRGSRAIFREPIPVDANGTEEDNAWYSPHDRSLTFGLGGIDEAEDAEIILHELGHAIQDAICPGFGQSQEAAAMGEGFGDYFAASFFADAKPRPYKASIGSWDGIEDGEDPPCVRRLDEELTYESFDHGESGDEHDNGHIWSATLWDIRTALGRDIADRIILESHFQLDGFTTLARAARAIIDADRNLNHGRHIAQLRPIFHRRA